MYAWFTLQSDPQELKLGLTWYRISSTTAPVLKPGEQQARTKLIDVIVKASYPRLDAADRTRLIKEAAVIAPLLPPDDKKITDFVIHAFLAHLNLPAARRQARERTVEEGIQRYLGDVGQPPAWLGDTLSRMRLGALLVPDDWSGLYLATECARTWQLLASESIAQQQPSTLNNQFKQICSAVMLASPPDDSVLLTALYGALSATPPDARGALCEVVASLMATDHIDSLRAAVKLHDSLPRPREAAMVWLCLGDMLLETARNARLPPDEALPVEDVLTATLARTVELRAAKQRCTTLHLVHALETGVPLGILGTESRDVLNGIGARLQEVDDAVTPDRLRQSARPAPTTAATTDVDPVHAWSVSRLVKWIEGPLVSRSAAAPQRIDLARIATQDGQAKRARQQNQNAGQRSTANRRPQPKGFTAADIGLVVQDALGATARFFIDDINELLPLAATLNAPPEAMEACRRLLEPLGTLLQPGAHDDTARQQLGMAEAAVQALRTGIATAEVARKKQARFHDRLRMALQAEPLVLGKRHGGVIDCPMAIADWPWVSDTYHRRWLPQAQSLVIDGAAMPLAHDQALALYVTGSSLSGHAFDLSVHLWQRRPDRDGAPTRVDGGNQTMDIDNWFDTYLPCCVLHVPG